MSAAILLGIVVVLVIAVGFALFLVYRETEADFRRYGIAIDQLTTTEVQLYFFLDLNALRQPHRSPDLNHALAQVTVHALIKGTICLDV